jgi:type VI secretion system protein ImpA
MSLKRFLEPISPDSPCGPDLFDAMDDPFEAYLLDAEDRLPQVFFTPDGKFRVDPTSIKMKTEIANASALLERSRDLRVLAWLAQFSAAARDLTTLVETVEVMAGLLESYGAHVHPRATEDVIDRCNALEMLDGGVSMRLPLEFMPLAKDRRLNILTWRRVAIADGRRSPVAEDGQPLERDTLMAALRAAENTDQITASHALVSRLKAAMTQMEYACLASDDNPFRPNLEKVQAQIDAILALLHEARPDLAGDAPGDTSAPSSPGALAEDQSDASARANIAAGAAPRASGSAPSGAITTAPQARQALEALDQYFARFEPSSPSFILVRQARQLQGRPLVEALELLVPERFEAARIDFSRDTGFVLTMERMRALSDLDQSDDRETEPDDETPALVVTSRSEAGSTMSALERYFASTEPSSPIPLLLTRARGYLNQSFSAILGELFPRDDT